MGRGRKCILPSRIGRRIVRREATKSPRITVKELQALVASWGHQVKKDATQTPPPQPQALWKGCQKKALNDPKIQTQALGVCQTSFKL